MPSLIGYIFVDRTRVRLTLESQQQPDGLYSYQTYELESTIEIAEQFCDQILNIIQLKNPHGHDMYEQQQQQRQQQEQRDNVKKRRFLLNIFGTNTGSSSSSTKP